ncbi:nadph-ferrihemo reductase [Fusarium albosuccineum]|uniref:Nadph-ferrihemo reductase n=1 Tax=Fusarium albosuccineum TaxID=1237068 RepID=A0A8H4KZU9_9HYPO|nr:nadph-ferrihemo reductase [Fusarium albosuccineum]
MSAEQHTTTSDVRRRAGKSEDRDLLAGGKPVGAANKRPGKSEGSRQRVKHHRHAETRPWRKEEIETDRPSTDSRTSMMDEARWSTEHGGGSASRHSRRFVVAEALDKAGAQRLMPVGRANDAQGGTEEDFLSWKDDLYTHFQEKLGYEERDIPYEPSIKIVEDESLDVMDLGGAPGYPQRRLSAGQKLFIHNGVASTNPSTFHSTSVSRDRSPRGLVRGGIRHRFGQHSIPFSAPRLSQDMPPGAKKTSIEPAEQDGPDGIAGAWPAWDARCRSSNPQSGAVVIAAPSQDQAMARRLNETAHGP